MLLLGGQHAEHYVTHRRPDDAVLTALDDLTALTRASGRALLDYPARDGPPIATEFADDYARMLQLLASAARQLADPRGSRSPGAEQAEAPDCQRRLEAAAAGLPRDSGEAGIAQRLARLTGEMLRAADALSEARPDRPANARRVTGRD